MHHKLQWFIQLRARGLSKADEHPAYTPVWHTLPLNVINGFCVINCSLIIVFLLIQSWWRSTVVERRSLTGELSLSCARPAADG